MQLAVFARGTRKAAVEIMPILSAISIKPLKEFPFAVQNHIYTRQEGFGAPKFFTIKEASEVSRPQVIGNAILDKRLFAPWLEHVSHESVCVLERPKIG
jgi:hypothetical protein